MTNSFIELDGSHGEGGGQILRSALSLSMITGIPFRIERIRAKRQKPGLLRQHLTAVNAAAQICGAQLKGAEPGSLQLEFVPGPIQGGQYQYAIGSAGSCTLVLQTVLPALWFANAPSSFTISGGTHNPAAPPADFLQAAWLPLLRRMGVDMQLEVLRHGFYPAGGGELRVEVTPVQMLQPLHLQNQATPKAAHATAIVAAVTSNVAQRELLTLQDELSSELGEIGRVVRALSSREGPGNALLLALDYGDFHEVFTAFGEKGIAAEKVAGDLAREVRQHLASGVNVGEYLADQLLLPMALAGGGSFATSVASAHLHTNIAVIEKFLDVEIDVKPINSAYYVSISGEAWRYNGAIQ